MLKDKGIFFVFLISVFLSLYILNVKQFSKVTVPAHESWNSIMASNYVNNSYKNQDMFRLVRNNPSYLDSEHEVIYTSYPPGFIIAPLVLRYALDRDITVLDLRIINLFFYGLGAIFLYLISSKILSLFQIGRLCKSFFSILSVIALSSFPAVLGYQIEMFNYETSFNFYLLIFVFFATKYGINNFVINHKYIYILTSFLLCYTDWTGIFIVFFTFLYFIFQQKHILEYRYKYYLTLLSPGVAAIILFLYQVIHSSNIVYIFDKLILRLGLIESMENNTIIASDTNFLTILNYIETYFSSYYLYLFLFSLFFVILIFIKEKKKHDLLVIPVVILPISIIIKLVLFSNHTTGHTFSIILLSLPFALIGVGLFPLVLSFIGKYAVIGGGAINFSRNIVFLLILVTSIINLQSYGDKFERVTSYNQESLALFKLISDKESIVVTNKINLPVSPPQLAYIAGKNSLTERDFNSNKELNNSKKEYLFLMPPPDYLKEKRGGLIDLGGGLFLWK